MAALVDFAVPAGQVDNVTDSDAGAKLGIAVTAANTSNGSWWYSKNNGTNWYAGRGDEYEREIAGGRCHTRIYFTPNTNYYGTLSNAITFRAWDQTSGTNGGSASTSKNGGSTAFSTATDTASLMVEDLPPVEYHVTFVGGVPDSLTTTSWAHQRCRYYGRQLLGYCLRITIMPYGGACKEA